MKALKELLSELTFTCERGNLEKEITAVVYDSRKIVEGCLFVCIKGANFDGHQAAAEAAEKKAAEEERVPAKENRKSFKIIEISHTKADEAAAVVPSAAEAPAAEAAPKRVYRRRKTATAS